MYSPHHQTTGQNRNMEVSNKSSKNVMEFLYLGTLVTNSNFIHRRITSRLSAGNLPTMEFRIFCVLVCCLEHEYHYNEHNRGLGLKTCSFKGQGVLVSPSLSRSSQIPPSLKLVLENQPW
jgi:hypothetical protein